MSFSTCSFIMWLFIFSFWIFNAHGFVTPVSNPFSSIDSTYCTTEQNTPFGCGGELMSAQNTEALNQMYKNQIVEYFSDVVFKNAECRCQGNNGCTRGCRLEGFFDSRSPVFRECRGDKRLGRSGANCARHITGAIMTVIHDLLADRCTDTGYGMKDYQQCVDNFREDLSSGNISLCRHGFVFHSALCMLNLDSQGSHVYKDIRNRGVRSNCKNWDQHNQSLLSVDIPFHYGETMKIPLFRKVSSERNEEFQRDPRQIPEGAIIVTRSHRKEGHVEIKTRWNECGKNNTQTCFCSDYCRERLRYTRPVLAVFEWNPEFLRYVMNENSY